MFILNPKVEWKTVKLKKKLPPLVLCLVVAGRLACPCDPESYDGGSLCSWHVKLCQIALWTKGQTKQHPGPPGWSTTLGARWSAEDWATDAATKLHHSHWTGNQVIKHTWGMVDIRYLYSVITHTDCSSSLVVIMDPQLHPWCLPHTFQISDWKLVEDTTCMKLDSLWWLDACVWPDSNESWTCGYGVVVFGWWTVSAETSVTGGGLTFGMIRIY